MTSEPSTREIVERFLTSIAQAMPAYTPVFCFLALRGPSGDFELCLSRLWFALADGPFSPSWFESSNICAGRMILTDNQTAGEFIKNFLTGKITVNNREFIFPADASASYNVVHTPHHPDGVRQQRQLNVLTIRGA